MLATLEIIVLIGVIWTLGYIGVSTLIWTPILAAVLLWLSFAGEVSWAFLSIAWLIFIVYACIAHLTVLRQHYISKPILSLFRRLLPPISRTEREALEAGDVWWDADLFSGKPDWKKLLQVNKPTLTTEEQAFLDNEIEQLCSMLDDWQIVQEQHDLPAQVWQFMKDKHIFAMNIAKKYGGLEFSPLAQSSIITKISTRSCSAAVTAMVPNSLGPAELLQHYGTEEQKQQYLPKLADGSDIPCFALTGLENGSDAGAMPDTGIVCKEQYQGQEVVGIRLNWSKRYLTLAPVATVIGMAFKLEDPEHLLGEQQDVGITVCLIPSDHPGVEIGQRHLPLNMAFMNGPTTGKDVFIPLDWIIGGPKMAGHGWRMLMECLSAGRSISLPAISSSVTQLAYRMTGAYSRIREQFNVPIGKFEGISEAMGAIGGYSYLMEATRVMTAGAVGMGIKPGVISAIAKYHMTEISREVMSHAMDIQAGRGIQLGPRNYLGHGYQALPIGITVEGANILTRNLIIFGQGSIRCHPFIFKEMEAAASNDHRTALVAFDDLLMSHIGHFGRNKIRAFTMGITGAKFVTAPVSGPTAKYYRQLSRMSAGLALATDVAMLMLGGALKRKECLSARLGDVLSHLFLASAVLKQHHDGGQQNDELPYVHWALQQSLYKIQEAFYDFFDNFPNRAAALWLKVMIFPLGHSYKKPADSIHISISNHMMKPSTLRDNLSALCYIGASHDDVTGRMEHAFNSLMDVSDIIKKLKTAISQHQIPRQASLTQQIVMAKEYNLLSEQEIEQLTAYDALRIDALAVDSFDKSYFLRKAND